MKAVKNGFKKYIVVEQWVFTGIKKECAVLWQNRKSYCYFYKFFTNLTHPIGHLNTEIIGTIQEIIANTKRNLDIFYILLSTETPWSQETDVRHRERFTVADTHTTAKHMACSTLPHNDTLPTT